MVSGLGISNEENTLLQYARGSHNLSKWGFGGAMQDSTVVSI